MHGVMASHNERDSFRAAGARIVYDPEFPGWHLTTSA
jgi:hypothetical protein